MQPLHVSLRVPAGLEDMPSYVPKGLPIMHTGMEGGAVPAVPSHHGPAQARHIFIYRNMAQRCVASERSGHLLLCSPLNEGCISIGCSTIRHNHGHHHRKGWLVPEKYILNFLPQAHNTRECGSSIVKSCIERQGLQICILRHVDRPEASEI